MREILRRTRAQLYLREKTSLTPSALQCFGPQHQQICPPHRTRRMLHVISKGVAVTALEDMVECLSLQWSVSWGGHHPCNQSRISHINQIVRLHGLEFISLLLSFSDFSVPLGRPALMAFLSSIPPSRNLSVPSTRPF